MSLVLFVSYMHVRHNHITSVSVHHIKAPYDVMCRLSNVDDRHSSPSSTDCCCCMIWIVLSLLHCTPGVAIWSPRTHFSLTRSFTKPWRSIEPVEAIVGPLSIPIGVSVVGETLHKSYYVVRTILAALTEVTTIIRTNRSILSAYDFCKYGIWLITVQTILIREADLVWAIQRVWIAQDVFASRMRQRNKSAGWLAFLWSSHFCYVIGCACDASDDFPY